MKGSQVEKGEGFFKRFINLLSALFNEKEEEVVVRKRPPQPLTSRLAAEINLRKHRKTESERAIEEEYEKQWRIAQREYERRRGRRLSPREAALMRQADEEAMRMQRQMNMTTLHMHHIAHAQAMQMQQQATNQANQQIMNNMNGMNGMGG